MIGNDVVDLELAKTESNWQRNGFLDKIFSKNEQNLIQNSKNQEITIWNLWSRKEAVYKIWNRKSAIRKYNPIQFECFDLDLEIGKVFYDSIVYYTKTDISTDFIYTIAVCNLDDFSNIETLDNSIKYEKENGIPFYINENQEVKPISKTHHGRFERIITIK